MTKNVELEKPISPVRAFWAIASDVGFACRRKTERFAERDEWTCSGLYWDLLGFYWDFMEILGIYWDFIGISWDFMDSHGI